MNVHNMNSANWLTLFLIVVCCLVDSTTQQASTFECGRLPINRRGYSSRISGGWNASPGELPWMARIEIRNRNQFIVCGGTLISDRHVLTAAHCLFNDNGYPTFQSLNITLGATDVSIENEPGRQTFGLKRIVAYTDWTLLENDIAIITLSRSVDFTDYVQPACLPFEDDPNHVFESVRLTGWGIYDDTNTYSSVLKYHDNDVMPWWDCQQTAGVGNFSENNIICSGYNRYYVRYYHGDDGGPMNYLKWDCDRWFVIGVAGKGESFNWTNTKPNLFSRVRAHLDFIRSHTGVASPNDCSSGQTTESGVDTTTDEIKTTTSNAETTTESPTTSAILSTQHSTTTQTTPTGFRTTTPSSTTTTTSPKTNPPTTTTTTITTSTTTTNTPMTFDCAGKTDGNHPASNSICSSTFYMCSNGNAYLFNCASDLVYREELRVCDWPSNVAGCH